jgi:hypothetical protein
MVVSNTHTNTANLHMERFKKDLKGYKSAKNVLTGEVMDQLSNLKVAGHTTLVLELQK